jgi:ABC-type multidrug transport system ATPase subunit/ABC-type transport system involved in multi-copper enzyme maturation permease subunit
VRDRERIQRRLGYLPGDFVGYRDLTGSEYLRYLANLRGGVDWAVPTELARRLDLDLGRRIGTLSHGNRQKVGIVQALMNEPDLLILDEPTAGLDPLIQREFLALLREARGQGRTVFLSSHILSEVEAVADLVGILRQGRLAVVESVDKLKARALRRIDLTFEAAPPLAELRTVPGVRDTQLTGHTVHLVVEGSTADLLRTAAPHRIENVVTHEADLEEIFLAYYREGPDGMLGNVFLKSLRDQRRALIGWCTGTVLLVGLIAGIWTSFRDMPDLEQFLASYPKEFGRLFNIEAMTTGAGYLNAELFSIILPVLFIIFGIGRGARMIAGEEEAGTLETILVTPVSPVSLLLHQAAALATGLAVLGAALWAALVASSAMFGMDMSAAQLAAGSLAMVLLGIEHGYLALAVGAITGRRSLAITVAAVVAVLGYVLYIAGQLVDSVRPWQPVSPFHQAIHGGPIGGLVGSCGWMALAAAAFVAVAMPIFNRRDIAGH